MQKTEIPRELLDSLNDSVESDRVSENGVENGTPDVDPEKLNKLIENVNFMFSWGYGVADDYCKEKDLPGFGSLDLDDLAELSTIVAKKNIPLEKLKHTPEVALAVILSGVAGQNLIALRKKENQEDQEGQEDQEDQEQPKAKTNE